MKKRTINTVLRFFRLIVICAVIGGTFSTTMHLYGISRANRDNFIYVQGRKDGFNDCKKQNTGVILPNGVTELTEHWLTTESL